MPSYFGSQGPRVYISYRSGKKCDSANSDIDLSVTLSICPAYLPIDLPTYLPTYLPIYPSIYLSIYVSIYPSIYLSIYRSVLSIYLSFAVSLSLLLSFFFCLSVSSLSLSRILAWKELWDAARSPDLGLHMPCPTPELCVARQGRALVEQLTLALQHARRCLQREV